MEVIREAAQERLSGNGRRVPAKNTIDLLHHSSLSWLAEARACRLYFLGAGPTGSFEEFLRDLLQEGKGEIRPARTLRRGILGGAGFGPKPVSPQELISVLYPILNPIRATKLGEPIYQPSKTISEQVALSTMSVLPQGLKCEGMETRVISLEQSPEATFPGMISELLRMNGNYLMTINFHVPSKEKRCSS